MPKRKKVDDLLEDLGNFEFEELSVSRTGRLVEETKRVELDFSGFLKDRNEDVSQQFTSQEQSSHYSAIEEAEDDRFFDDFEEEPDEEARNFISHGKRKLKLLSSWRKERESMIKAHRNSYCISPVAHCIGCSSENPEFRCKDCGPYSFFCLKCLIETHKQQNFFHFPEKWQVYILV